MFTPFLRKWRTFGSSGGQIRECAADPPTPRIASAAEVTRFSKLKPDSCTFDDALMAPWAATGVIAPLDARLFAAAVASDPTLEDDFAAAHAEHVAVFAMGEALGRPSKRPMLALFAAIDQGHDTIASNVTRFMFSRMSRLACDDDAPIDLKPKKFGRAL